jgi:glutamate-5-semialdehyde dehydrogenase
MKATVGTTVETNRLKDLQVAARELRTSSADSRNQVLQSLHDLLLTRKTEILSANLRDMQSLPADATTAFRDRLKLTDERIQQMAESLLKVRSLGDPLNEVVEASDLPNGLRLKKVRSPLGVILMIFEARPNVITEAYSLALKSGNAIILRGGRESLETAQVIYKLISEALHSAGLPQTSFWGVTNPDRALSHWLMQQSSYIDVLVPRGGDSLIQYVVENAKIPIIKNDRGLCHVYVHADANDEMALSIIENAKTQRPGVCNSMETLLIHKSKSYLLPKIYERLQKSNVEWFVSPEIEAVLGSLPKVSRATEVSYNTEYLDMKINAREVSSLDEALEHIARFGSKHSECIVTQAEPVAREFQGSVDAAVVYWNASTRFTDGFEFGLGGELGISTQKLHVRGPVGLKELTSLRWIVDGTGQVRR